MLNFKKGLALVLAAATAFTFAPVANLGNAVQAEAAETTKLADKSGTIKLNASGTGNTATVKISDLSGFGLSDDDEKAGVTAHVADKNIATISGTGSGNGTPVDSAVADETVIQLVKDDKLTITAVKAGTTTVTLSFGRATHKTADFTQKLTIVVGDLTPVSEADFSKIEAKLTRNADGHNYYTTKANSSATAAEQPSADYADVQVKINNYNLTIGQAYTLDATTTNSDVAAINRVATTTNGTTDTATAGSWTASETTADTTTAALTVRLKSIGTATINVRLYASATAGEKTKLVTEVAIPVSVTNGIDVFTVKYDANRDGADETAATLSTSSADNSLADTTGLFENGSAASTALPNSASDPNIGTIYSNSISNPTQKYASYWDGTTGKLATTLKTAQATPAIYLDTDKNSSIKITATDSQSRNIIYSSSTNYISVDQQGNVSINEKKLPNDEAVSAGGYIYIDVPQSGTGASTVSAFRVVVPVTVANQDTTSITVKKSNGETIAKTVGGTNFNKDVTKLGTIYLSTADKKSDTVTVESSTGAAYLSGQAYTGLNGTSTNATDVNNIASDAVTYTAGSGVGTISLTDKAKSGDSAIVKLVANNSSSQVNDAKVYFRVVVTSKKANVKVTAPSSISLSAATKTTNLNATVNSTSQLKYAFVSSVGDSTSAGTTTYGDLSVDQSGNVKYNGTSTGTAVIRITGYETTDSLAPEAAYVTVNYSSTKNAQTITVDPASISLKAGETAQINAKSVVTGAAITYKSSDETVATVDATGKVTAVKDGSTTITVSAPATTDYEAGTATVTVKVTGADPAKVTGVKVSNKKGAKVTVSFTKDTTNPTMKYYVQKKVSGKTSGKSVGSTKTTLSVKKGATVKVRVKAYYYDANGVKHVGKYSAWKTLKTDKK